MDPFDEIARRLGPHAERRIPVYHLDELARLLEALDDAWTAAISGDLRERLRAAPGSARLLAPAVIREEGTIVLVVNAPGAVCAAFDERAGRLDSHTEFGR